MAGAEIHVAPDRFEVTSGGALLVAELRSAIAVCMYDADKECGALLHLRLMVRQSKPADVTDTTLATELLMVHRCLDALHHEELGGEGRVDRKSTRLNSSHRTIS